MVKKLFNKKGIEWWHILIGLVVIILFLVNKPTPTQEGNDGGGFCPDVCVPIWQPKLEGCVFSECGSGCEADGISTFNTESECKLAIGNFICCNITREGEGFQQTEYLWMQQEYCLVESWEKREVIGNLYCK